jgi:hypothetical protein
VVQGGEERSVMGEERERESVEEMVGVEVRVWPAM